LQNFCTIRREGYRFGAKNSIVFFLFVVLREDFRLEPADTRAAAGDTALLECAPPRGAPDPTVSWKKNGQLLDVDESSR
jgi:hypothetical protein